MRGGRKTIIFGYRFQQNDHITLQELKTSKTLIIRLCDDVRNHGCRILIAVDSKASGGAVGKGRSPSYRMNHLLKIGAPYLIAAEIYVSLLWMRSEANVADNLTRHADLR